MTTDDDMARLASALGCLDPSDRTLWVQMAMCIKSALGEAGFDVWNDWGSRADNHCPRAAKAVWRSVREGGRTTVASLFFRAGAAGWEDPFRHAHWARHDQPLARWPARSGDGGYTARYGEADDARQLQADQAAKAAQRIWNAATQCCSHPYLERKGVASHGLRQGRWEVVDSQTGDVYATTNQGLLIPIRDHNGKIWTLQCVHPSPARKKLFLKGGAKRAHFFEIGQSVDGAGAPVVVLAEGYATGASIYAATGLSVLVCFDTSNLLPVARALRDRRPDARLLFGADNDVGVAGNPGVTKAMEAASAVAGEVVVPPPGDFNDLHLADGLQAVRRVFETQLEISLPPVEAHFSAVGHNPKAIFTPDARPFLTGSQQPTGKQTP